MPNKPNIIIIMTDQQQTKMCKREGFEANTMPFIDSLAKEGVWFEKAYTTCPLCSPARVSMLTGRYGSAHHIMHNPRPQHDADFPDPWIVNEYDVIYEKDILDVARSKGYTTALVGKNHAHPDNKKFDYVCSFHHAGGFHEGKTEEEIEFDDWIRTLPQGICVEPTPFAPKQQIPYRVVTKAMDWIENHRENPFLLWLSFPEPHNPYQVPEPYFSMFDGDGYVEPDANVDYLENKNYKWQVMYDIFSCAFSKDFNDLAQVVKRARSNYMGMLRFIDDQIKRFVNYLKGLDIFDNTIIVFLSDHGDFAGEFGFLRKGVELSELLTRIPLIFIGPGILRGKKMSDMHVSIADIMPTLCEALEADIPDSVQGKSLWPMLTGQQYPKEDFQSAYCELGNGGNFYSKNDVEERKEHFYKKKYQELNTFAMTGLMRMVRKGEWKLVYDMKGHGEMYHLAKDPNEIHNLYNDPQYAAKKTELIEELLKWCINVQDPMVIREDGYQIKQPRLIDKHHFWFGKDYK